MNDRLHQKTVRCDGMAQHWTFKAFLACIKPPEEYKE